MSNRCVSGLIVFGVLTAGCAEILGEDFSGYRLKCTSGSSCGGAAGIAGLPGESAGENSGGTAGKGGAAGSGGTSVPLCGGVKCSGLDPHSAGSGTSADSAGNVRSVGNTGAGGSGGNAGWAGSGGIGGSLAGAGSAGLGGAGSSGTASSGGVSSSAGFGGAGSSGTASSGGVSGSAGFGDGAGTGGISGSFGGGSSAGIGNASGSGETAGSGNASGSGGTTCQSAVTECQPGYSAAMLRIRGIGMYSAEQFGGGFQIFAAKRGSSTVATVWNTEVDESKWTEWVCHDSLPQPDRLAANALMSGGAKEVFVTTGCGELYRGAFLYDDANNGAWYPSERFSLPPPGPAVTDVAVTEGVSGAEVVYVADAGRVFARPRLGTDQSAPFSDWFEITGVSNASLVTAGLRSDGRLQAFVVDGNGSVRTAIQSTTDSTSPFAAWSDFDDSSQLSQPVLDIEAPNGGPLPLEVFAVDSNGALWQRAQDKTTGVFGPWKVWDGPTPPGKLTSLTGAGLQFSKNAVRLTVLTQDGNVYSSKRTLGTWDDWRWFP